MEIACIEDADQDNMTSSDYKSLEFEEDVFMMVETMPEFPGGTAALTDYLKKETIYPEQAREDSGRLFAFPSNRRLDSTAGCLSCVQPGAVPQ